MLKYLASVFLLNTCLLFGASGQAPHQPQKKPDQEKLDFTSSYAKQKLQRAQNILATLVPDPQSYQLILSNNPDFGGQAIPPHVYSDKPSMVIFEGALSPKQSTNELAFMMAHELGHLNMHHNEKMDERMDKLFNGPTIGISGLTFNVFAQKLDERQADMFGYKLYKRAGYDLTFFQKTFSYLQQHPGADPHSHKEYNPLPSLSMNDPHFCMFDRFELLAHQS